MSTTPRGLLNRLARPRSRRARLWSGVYCAVFDDATADPDGAEPSSSAD